MKPTINIEYCPKCHWLLRAAYMAQEFLTTFADEIKSVTLTPSEVGGRYIIFIDGEEVYNRESDWPFPRNKRHQTVNQG